MPNYFLPQTFKLDLTDDNYLQLYVFLFSVFSNLSNIEVVEHQTQQPCVKCEVLEAELELCKKNNSDTENKLKEQIRQLQQWADEEHKIKKNLEKKVLLLNNKLVAANVQLEKNKSTNNTKRLKRNPPIIAIAGGSIIVADCVNDAVGVVG
jgi:hypothetical protein